MKKRLTTLFLCLCLVFTMLPATALAGEEQNDGTGAEPGAGCICTGLCGEESINKDCPVCSVEGIDLTVCQGEETQPDTPETLTEAPTDVTESSREALETDGVIITDSSEGAETEAEEPAAGCICTGLCSEDNVNKDCPICGVEGTDLSGCKGAASAECTCETLCTEEEINGDCPVCSAEGAELDKVCVGAALLLTAPTLRTGEIELYVGGQQIKESGCYENQNGTWKKVDGTEPANGQFSYDADTFTLTLNQAMIVNYQDVTVGGGFTYPGSVIAFSQSADVSLTIVVSQGTSNITGTGGIRVVSKAGDASLSISGPGSLEVKNVSNDSGIVLIGSKNVNLGINSADVTISNVQYYGVQLAAGDACKSTATINDGNLTVSDSVVGIYFMRLYTSDPSSLTVSGNAMVDTEGKTGGIINGFPDSFQIGADGESGGIVFNGNSGTVYGNVTLQEDLEIGTDETLTIGKDASLTVPDGKTLTNNGTIINNGTLTGEVGGSGTVTPKITTDSLPNGTVGEFYTATLEATGNNITWSASGLPDGLTLNSDGTITGTPTAEGTSTVTVKAENSAGSTSKDYTLNIKPATVPVTGLELNKNSLTLQEKGSDTLTVTVKPADATNQDVTWESSNTSIATVSEDGTVTAISAGNATITATAAASSGVSATCTVTVTPSTYSISADTTALNFGSVYTGYTQPTAKTVTITNTGNQTLNLNQPASTTSFEVGNLSKTELTPNEKATFTVQPKAGLAVGSYKESINISGSNGNHTVSTSVDATFAVVDINDTSVDNKLTVTSGISDNITYYTCPSCGYHNWTATDAGYRCDNCGYLESTRQLSGYGNVKGTYTPGSGATSTAVSTVPQTGDESNPVLWTVLLLVSGLALGGLALRRKTEHSRS